MSEEELLAAQWLASVSDQSPTMEMAEPSTGKNPSAFKKGDVIRHVHKDLLYEVEQVAGRDGVGTLRDLQQDIPTSWNWDNNPVFELYQHQPEGPKATREGALKAKQFLQNNFMSDSQLQIMWDCCDGEEGQFFIDKLVEMQSLISSMPKTYEQDGKGDEAMVYLHYFSGGCDWYITERDRESEQIQAFGMADIGYGGELGYISLIELCQNGVELDLHFKPQPLREVKGESNDE